ncbi:MAG: outer membrane beta-barrel protein [Bacteroidales bacterium]|nr:outer membrane beta-barrel protein [Bacteroidales bacterium]
MKNAFFTLLLMISAASFTLRAQDADSLRFQTVSLGVLLQGNVSGERMHITELAVSGFPNVGVEAGGFIDYYMTPRLMLEFQLVFALQSSSYIYEDKNFLMALWGMDSPLFLIGTIPVRYGSFRLGAGPFTHLTFDTWDAADRTFVTPYQRVISVDDVTGKPRYALNDNHSGFGALVGFEFRNHLQINVSAKYSITDIINYKSEYSYCYPYKISFGAAYRF